MQKHRLKVPLLAVSALLVFTGTAEAHISKANATCTDTTINFTAFNATGGGNGGNNTVHYKVTTNGNPVVDTTATFTGTNISVTVPNPLFNGDVVQVNTHWAFRETRDGHSQIDKQIFSWTAVNCGDKPPVVPPAVVPPAVVPPAVVPPAVVPSAGGVLPESIASGQARLRGPSGCAKQAFKARLNGRSITSVAFFLDGKLLKKFTKNATAYSINVNPKRYGFGRHKLVAKVTFVAASGTKSRTLPLTFRRCAQGAAAPRFTG